MELPVIPVSSLWGNTCFLTYLPIINALWNSLFYISTNEKYNHNDILIINTMYSQHLLISFPGLPPPNYHKGGYLNNRNLFPCSSGGLKSKTESLQDLFPLGMRVCSMLLSWLLAGGGSPWPSLADGPFTPVSASVFPWHSLVLARTCLSLFPFYKALGMLD